MNLKEIHNAAGKEYNRTVWGKKKQNTRRGKHTVQYTWCELFPEDCFSLIVRLQPEYSDAGQPASACYCSAV